MRHENGGRGEKEPTLSAEHVPSPSQLHSHTPLIVTVGTDQFLVLSVPFDNVV